MSPRSMFVPIAATLVAILFTQACGDGGTEPTPDPPRATTVTVTPASAQLVALGATAQFAAQVHDQYGQVMTGVSVAWASSDASVAAVDASGLVTAAANGEATITATAGGVAGSAAVTVAQVVSAVAVSPAADTLAALGDTVRFLAKATDANGNVVAAAEFSWSSSDARVVAVDGSGLVTAAANGEATITATAGGVAGSAVVTVAQVVSAVAVSPAADTLAALGDTVRFLAKATDANGNVVAAAEFSWSSSDARVAAVDGSGLVTAAANGEATITATAGSASGSAAVTVAQSVRAVSVSPAAATLVAFGDTVRLVAEATDANGHAVVGAGFSWTSSDTVVARVDDSGLVTGVDEGTATITANAGDATGAAVVNVMQSAASVTVSPTADTIAPGDTLRLMAEAFDENGHRVQDAEFHWASSDVAVVRVDASGLATGAGEGRATVTARVGEVSASSEITVINPDRAALAAFYEATGGPSWVDNTNWLTDAPLEEWHGVRTDASGRVVTLDLRGNSLIGRIPPEAGLSALLRLTLADNRLTLTGDSFAGLPRLQHLNLRRNELGALPEGVFDGLHDLRTLVLDVNPLTELSENVFAGLANLRSLLLSHTQLTELPGRLFRDQVHLTHLDLYANRKLTTLPPDLFRGLTSLSQLNLDTNALESLPDGLLDDLVNLRSLWLRDNRLTGLPRFPALPKVKRLLAKNNLITSVPPAAFEGLSGLQELSLSVNQLTQLPDGSLRRSCA